MLNEADGEKECLPFCIADPGKCLRSLYYPHHSRQRRWICEMEGHEQNAHQYCGAAQGQRITHSSFTRPAGFTACFSIPSVWNSFELYLLHVTTRMSTWKLTLLARSFTSTSSSFQRVTALNWKHQQKASWRFQPISLKVELSWIETPILVAR